MPDEKEIAWATGLFEGEGCIGIYPLRPSHTGTYRIAISLSTTDRDVLERFVSVVGCGSIKTEPRSNPRYKTIYNWYVSGRKCRPVLEMFLSGLGKRRRAKAAEALVAIAALKIENRLKTECPKGHPYDETNTRIDRLTGQRCCRACEQAQNAAWRARLVRAR